MNPKADWLAGRQAGRRGKLGLVALFPPPVPAGSPSSTDQLQNGVSWHTLLGENSQKADQGSDGLSLLFMGNPAPSQCPLLASQLVLLALVGLGARLCLEIAFTYWQV